MKRHKLPPRRDSRITSQFFPETGEILIGVAQGFTGAGEILYRLDQEKLAGAIEDRKELAVIVNNLGLLVLAQLSGFNLAESLDGLPKALAQWAHIDVAKALKDEQADTAEALRIAQKLVHRYHGHSCDPDYRLPEDAPCSCICECAGTATQTICAGVGCSLCKANAALAALDPKFAYEAKTDADVSGV